MTILWLLEALCTILSLIGAFYISARRRVGFVFWLFSNAGWIAFAIAYSHWGMCFLFVVYWVLAAYGYLNWGKEEG